MRIVLKQQRGLFDDLEKELNEVSSLLLFAITHFEL